jgi:hypothetical protein
MAGYLDKYRIHHGVAFSFKYRISIYEVVLSTG